MSRAASTMTACRNCAGSEPVLGPAKPDPGDRRDLPEARRDLAAWLAKWSSKYPKPTGGEARELAPESVDKLSIYGTTV
jgi:hypothetical protein